MLWKFQLKIDSFVIFDYGRKWEQKLIDCQYTIWIEPYLKTYVTGVPK